jgi:hypothetical protein
MRLLFLDFETYFDKAYSLRKLTPPEYILDERFETICMAAAWNYEPVQFIDGPDCKAWLDKIDQAQTITVTYNALFDNCILAWRYGFIPWQMVDAMGMARCLLGATLRSLSLESVSNHLSLGVKGDTLKSVAGMHREDIFNAGLWDAFRQYCMNDVELTRKIYLRLQADFPGKEWPVLDYTLRAAVQPQFHTNVDMLRSHWAEIKAAKQVLVDSAQVQGCYSQQKSEVLGSASFLKLLAEHGVEVEMKEGKAGHIPAIAKTDDFMVKLQEHEDPIVQALAAARLGLKSTIEETRTERLISIASAFAKHGGVPLMPIPLRYAGARTHRFSGEWKINAQNFPRGSKLRQSLMAPPGHSVLVGDLSQIEARLVAWLAGAKMLLHTFASGGDPYKTMAAYIFKVKVDRVSPFQRFIGKAAVLGLGYGMGADKFYHSVVRTARIQAMDMALLANWTPELAKDAVNTYRIVNVETKHLWYRLNMYLDGPWRGIGGPTRLGPMVVGYRKGAPGYGYIQGPTGVEIRYFNPRVIGTDYFYSWGGAPSRLYGAAALENISQHLAGVLIKGALVRMKANGYLFAHQVHDELVYVVPTDKLTEVAALLMKELTFVPTWAKGLPLAAEVKAGPNYGDVKKL